MKGTITKEGSPLTLSCASSAPWFFCLWHSPVGGDNHQGGLPPHTVLRFVSTLVLLPLAQSCWRQTVCHSRGSGDFSLWRRWREDPSLRFTFLLQPFYREGFARGSRQLDVPSQRHH